MGKGGVGWGRRWWDDGAGGGDAHLDRSRSDGHAARVRGAERDGADIARGKFVFRSGVRVSWETRRSDQDSLVGWRRAVLVREAIGARAVHLAASGERNGFADGSATLHAAGRDRLAASGAQLRSADGGVSKL